MIWRTFCARLDKTLTCLGGWLSRYHVRLVFLGVAAIIVGVLCLGVWRVPLKIDDLLHDLVANADDVEATRSNVIALAALLAIITIFGTLIAQSIRVWTNERQTWTAEQGLVTDRLTKAIKQLGAEKQVKRIAEDAEGNEVRDEHGAQVVVETSEPNLEVRLGAIYALERIAQDSERDHVTIMEILCAYIRENAKAADAAPSPLGDLPDREEGVTLEARREELRRRDRERREWLAPIAPRIDIQAAATVIGRRHEDRIRAEKDAGFSLDLRGTCLRGVDLQWAQLAGANLSGVLLEGADLSWARLEEAILTDARLESARLTAARLENANLERARLESAGLVSARLEGAGLKGARLEKASLDSACLNGAQLNEARLECANLKGAQLNCAILLATRLEGASIVGARLENAYLNNTNLHGSRWTNSLIAGATIIASPAHFADLRGIHGLTQAQLNHLIGNEGTLLPDGLAPDTGEAFHVWSCWPGDAPEIEPLLVHATRFAGSNPDSLPLHAEFLCGPDNPREKTGTPLALDAPYPKGHPLAGRD